MDHLVTAWRRGYVYAGEYSKHRGRRHGRAVEPIDPGRLVVFSQNHDQVGNRVRGDRLAETGSMETLKLAARRSSSPPTSRSCSWGRSMARRRPSSTS